MKPFCKDGKVFIREATISLAKSNYVARVPCNESGYCDSIIRGNHLWKEYVRPRIFNHYIMNLPASASSFLPSFIGLFVGLEHLFTNTYPHPSVELEMPIIHLYCFSTKSDDNAAEKIKICDEISHQLQTKVLSGEKGVEIWPVRDVAPNKRMFCASFRLPAEVAFRQREGEMKEEILGDIRRDDMEKEKIILG